MGLVANQGQPVSSSQIGITRQTDFDFVNVSSWPPQCSLAIILIGHLKPLSCCNNISSVYSGSWSQPRSQSLTGQCSEVYDKKALPGSPLTFFRVLYLFPIACEICNAIIKWAILLSCHERHLLDLFLKLPWVMFLQDDILLYEASSACHQS